MVWQVPCLWGMEQHHRACSGQGLGCDRLVVFGDQKNDIDMFKAADACYAVSNAVDELKALATDLIQSNNEDGVARWLEEHLSI